MSFYLAAQAYQNMQSQVFWDDSFHYNECNFYHHSLQVFAQNTTAFGMSAHCEIQDLDELHRFDEHWSK